MKASDFHKGQTVYIYYRYSRYSVSGLLEMRKEICILECPVVSVGRRWLTIHIHDRDVRFDLNDNLKQDAGGYSPWYTVYLSKKEIEDWLDRTKLESEVYLLLRNAVVSKISDEDLETMRDILRRYL